LVDSGVGKLARSCVILKELVPLQGQTTVKATQYSLDASDKYSV
jgi:hypothetical protein